MPDGFNMVTAMETIHRHIHAVGCGALPSCWMTGDPSFFCRADGLFVPSLAVWFGAACRRPLPCGSVRPAAVPCRVVRCGLPPSVWRRFMGWEPPADAARLHVGCEGPQDRRWVEAVYFVRVARGGV